MRRRKLLIVGGTLLMGSIAGCGGDGNGEGESEATTTTEESEGTQTTVTDEPENEETTTEESAEDTIVYGDLYTFDSDYAVDVEYSDPDTGDSGTGSARYNGDNYYMRMEPDDSDDVYELYHIDGDDYWVLNEEMCYKNPSQELEPDSDVKSESDADAHGSKPDVNLEPDGTTELDGETVYIFEVSGEDIEGVLTLYVSASTGYLRRAEGEWGQADFHSWGEVDPISEPSMDCQTY
ncbi:hypothetical protein [Halodesulfurarchaeum sp.]|uniref:hypothetical protein n=1 Tax=Halodesulfurarchaeum sp. TaxID=1980530 RepID=UPI002FC3D134